MNERGMKNVLHCNGNPIYLLLKKELRGLSPAAPAAAHVDALRKNTVVATGQSLL